MKYEARQQRYRERFTGLYTVAESGCWEWSGALHRDGYGKWYFNGKTKPAHRVAYILFVGAVPDDLWVLHHCDNRRCVNPDHLYLGDAKQNTRDKLERCPWHGNMRVPFSTIERIRELYGAGNLSQQQLANQFSVHQTQVSRYVRGAQRLSK